MIILIKVRQIKVNIKDNITLEEKVAKKLKISQSDILDLKIKKRSIDARYKPDLYYIYEVNVVLKEEGKVLRRKIKDVSITEEKHYKAPISGSEKLLHRPIVVGSGPAGLFAALILAENGYKPLIIERGDRVDKRVEKVEKFWKDNTLDLNTNVQFGEGGAGTFSDGKLNTLVKDKEKRGEKVFETFIKHGADASILYDNKPHIGTNLLQKVIASLRKEIISLGGEFRYNTTLTDIHYEENKIKSIVVNDKDEIPCDVLVLAIGHSARDTFKMLYEKQIKMIPKPFAIGVRVQHRQDMISKSQYGENYKLLEPASYKLTFKSKENRGVYSFCMCPGGYVVNASSEEKRLVINGMSNHERESDNANSAIIVTVTPDDFGHHPMDGIRFQRNLEEKAYQVGNGKIPTQTLKDFYDNKKTTSFGNVDPIFKGDYTFADLNTILPDFVSSALKEAFPYFETKIKGFSGDDTILSAIESRTSSPIRINRDETLESNIEGIYPAGEGSGYAGGITTSAIDGIKVAEQIIKKYSNTSYL